jgi:hypothetical protein
MVFKMMEDYVTLEIPQCINDKFLLIRNKDSINKILEFISDLRTEINASDQHIKNVTLLHCRFR